MDLPTPDALLHHALDLAHAVGDPTVREDTVTEVAAMAAHRGARDLAVDALVDLPAAAARLRVHGLLAEHALRDGDPERSTQHLDRAIEALAEEPRWRPGTDGWVSLDDARTRLLTVATALGSLDRVDTIAAPLVSGRPAFAAAARARFELSVDNSDAERGVAWAEARAAARRLADPVDARRALVALASVAVAGGEAARAVRLVRADAENEDASPVHQAELAEAIAGVLAGADHLPEAATVWSRATDLATDPAVPLDVATWLLCSTAESQLDALGPLIAEHTMARAVANVADTPLSPDPVLRFPWRRLARTALSCPALAAPLRDHLRGQPVVPPGWCYALGLMELATGNPARARGAAKALESSHAAWPEDTESLWLAALLRCRLGDRERAIDDISTLLGQVHAGRPVWLAGDESGPQPLEQHLVRALLDLGDPDSAAELARATTAPGLRARLLREVGAVCVLGGERDVGAALAAEALQARDEARSADTPPTPLDADLPPLIRLLADSGEGPLALDTLRRALQEGMDTPDMLALPVLSVLARTLRPHPPLAEAVHVAFAQRLEAVAEPAAAARLLCAWLQQRD